jgi:hypothetical protein
MRFRRLILDFVVFSMEVLICLHVRQYPMWIDVECKWDMFSMRIVTPRGEVTGGEVDTIECSERLERQWYERPI